MAEPQLRPSAQWSVDLAFEENTIPKGITRQLLRLIAEKLACSSKHSMEELFRTVVMSVVWSPLNGS